METNQLLTHLLLFLFLPIWGIAGCVDWFCHRATKIESTSGLFESMLHSIMGIQIAIPILLCLLFKINVGTLIICLCVWLLHEIVAHIDVHYASPKREISIWEMHAHNYLATLPLFMVSVIFVINWPIATKMFSLQWENAFVFELIDSPWGGEYYLPVYLSFMAIVCVFPYTEEFFRCALVKLKQTHKQL